MVPQKAVNPFGDPDRPFRIGNTMREAYICSTTKQPNRDRDCVSDQFLWAYDPNTDLPYRLGDWMETETKFIRIGSFKLISIPGELAPELSTGLPKDFDTAAGTAAYYSNPLLHVTGADYTMPGCASFFSYALNLSHHHHFYFF